MGERRKWDRQPQEPMTFNATSGIAPTGASASDAPDPVLEKQMQYIKMLEERNRLKKKLAATTKKEQREKQREDAFVTTFNVPTAPAATGAAQDTVRKNKSSASLLPTRMNAQTSEGRGRSAPSTVMPTRFTPRGEADDFGAKADHKAACSGQGGGTRRAKWSKPAPGEVFELENRNGRALPSVDAKEDEKGQMMAMVTAGCAEDSEDYMEESFEEFEGEGDFGDSDNEFQGDSNEESIDEDIKPPRYTNTDISNLKDIGSRDDKSAVPVRAESKGTSQQVDEAASAGLSRTTTELFSVIHNLSRSKQKTLIDVLQKFQSSAQEDNDVQQLRSSIGDPSLWRQVASALFDAPTQEKEHKTHKAHDTNATLTVSAVLEEQQKWEEDYARQMQERLMKEREAKEKALHDAEIRRLAMLQQMEEEEKELQRLMEKKRQERLARIKALESEHHTATHGDSDITIAPATQPAVSMSNSTSSTASIGCVSSDSFGRVGVLHKGSVLPDSIVVPTLNLSTLPTAVQMPGALASVELRLRLLSTWGNTRAIGLTQISVYDASGAELDVDTASVKVFERSDGRALPRTHEMMRTVSRLFNGVAQTNNDQDMWLGRLPDSGALEIAFEVGSMPSKLCLWNYNSRLTSACARDAELIVGGRNVWNGSLPQGFGDEDDNVCAWINVSAGGRKTARITARESTHDVAENRPIRQSDASSRSSTVSESQCLTARSSSAPIWLSASTLASTLEAPGLLSSKADSKDGSHVCLDASPASNVGNLTSRRQRGESEDLAASVKDVKEAKEACAPSLKTRSTSHEATLHEATRSARGAELPQSWDSLEHFSKTSRSRLPSATDVLIDSTATQFPNPPLAPKFVPTTTSTFLAELKADSLVPEMPRNDGIKYVDSHNDAPTQKSRVTIPELPVGRKLKLEILSTWGDQYYVGLNGIEVFNERGNLVQFSHQERQVIACPPSINVLEEYNDDPRVAKNLVDGVNCTCDDFHMWLAPYMPGQEHYVLLHFDQLISLSMVRVWNYNKSRAHTFRGVRSARLLLFGDGKDSAGSVVFEGEIARAPGVLCRDEGNDSSMWCETILFTNNPVILQKIEANDTLLKAHGEEEAEEEETTALVNSALASRELRRPRTSDNGQEARQTTDNLTTLTEDEDEGSDASALRPTTSVAKRNTKLDVRKSIDNWVIEEPQEKSPVSSKLSESEDTIHYEEEENDDICEGMVHGRRITIRLLSTWGDRNYIGLTQLDVLVGSHGTPLTLDMKNIDSSPRDLATLGYEGDPRTLNKLINGIGRTCNDTNMWLIPFGRHQEIRIDLLRDQYIYGLRVWNYNKSLEDSFRGVKQISVAIDGELISPRQTGFLLRKAPGNAMFDFEQVLRFGRNDLGDKRDRLYVEKVTHPIQSSTYKTPIVKQDYESPLLPQGFALKFVFWTTWGDPYYLGLNGIELYDHQGKRITMKPAAITAQPHSLADINQSSTQVDDVRVPENLLSGKNKNTWDAGDAWLAPLASSLGSSNGNIVYVTYDTPIVLSLIKFWNYSKTPERGVKDMDIYLDDLQIFSGCLRKAPHGNDGQSVGRFGSKPLVTEEFSQPVLFSTNQAQVDAEKRRVFYCGSEAQDVLCINEGQVMQESKAMYRKPDPGAEGVVVDLAQRPTTAMCRK